ncbi:TKL family protein kinase [Histomonas meleagridis]|uniref:TKL family protein kinase n=1 Tax=Histomonas meleagridis TaxID=135588 RepID=UPI0035599FD0|nr:TKL family protein kinase [Histomonas meleagridis]KAH0799740.1 TKL family protein kinase [Histomonas meleagridis]
MTQLSSLPTTASSWAQTFNESFKYVDEALSYVVFNRSKCTLIAHEMNEFLNELERKSDNDLTRAEVTSLFEFLKATAAFIGIIYSYTPENWLNFFLTKELNQSYNDLSILWDAWSDCSTVLCFNSFESLDQLAFCHSQDLISIYTVITQGFSQFPHQAQAVVREKLEEIVSIIQSPQFVSNDESNKSILLQSDWEIIKPNIGRGGYATVHLAKLLSTGEEIAVKELHATQLNSRRINYLKREINSMTHLHHPNLLTLIGVTVTPPFCIATQFIPNGSLQSLIYQSDDLKPLLASEIALDVARAMEYLHAQGMIHRDLKPSNILMSKDYRAIVCDFGLTRMIAPIMSSELGTLQWMAPEILIPGGEYDTSVDVYAYGIILYEMCSRKFPYEGCKQVQIAAKVLQGERPEIPEGTPYQLKDLITRCWSQQIEKRPTMHQIVEELSNGQTLFPGTNSNEFRQWVKKTSPAHVDAIEALLKQQNDSNTLIARLSNLSPLDPLTLPTLKNIYESKLENPLMINDIINLALQNVSEPVQNFIIDIFFDYLHPKC